MSNTILNKKKIILNANTAVESDGDTIALPFTGSCYLAIPDSNLYSNFSLQTVGNINALSMTTQVSLDGTNFIALPAEAGFIFSGNPTIDEADGFACIELSTPGCFLRVKFTTLDADTLATNFKVVVIMSEASVSYQYT